MIEHSHKDVPSSNNTEPFQRPRGEGGEGGHYMVLHCEIMYDVMCDR